MIENGRKRWALKVINGIENDERERERTKWQTRNKRTDRYDKIKMTHFQDNPSLTNKFE